MILKAYEIVYASVCNQNPSRSSTSGCLPLGQVLMSYVSTPLAWDLIFKLSISIWHHHSIQQRLSQLYSCLPPFHLSLDDLRIVGYTFVPHFNIHSFILDIYISPSQEIY